MWFRIAPLQCARFQSWNNRKPVAFWRMGLVFTAGPPVGLSCIKSIFLFISIRSNRRLAPTSLLHRRKWETEFNQIAPKTIKTSDFQLGDGASNPRRRLKRLNEKQMGGRQQLWPRSLRLCRRFKWIQSVFAALKASAGCLTLLGWALWSPPASSADWLRSVI